jgi:hypothetical protein
MKRFSFAVSLLALALLVGLPSLAHADTISIGLQQAGVNGGAVTTVNSGSGSASISVLPYGTFTAVSVDATGSPFLVEPGFNSNSLNISGGLAGVLTVFVTEQGLSSPIGVNSLFSSLTSNMITSGWSVVESTLVSTSNALYGGTLLDSHTFTAIGTSTSTNSTPSLASPFSLTEEYVITATAGGGNTNDTINLSKVPEPSSLLMLGSGLIGLVGLRRRKLVA